MTFKEWQESRISVIQSVATPKNKKERARLSSDGFKYCMDSFVDTYGLDEDGFIYNRLGVIAILPKKYRKDPKQKYWVLLFNEEPLFYKLEDAEKWLWENFVFPECIEWRDDSFFDGALNMGDNDGR